MVRLGALVGLVVLLLRSIDVLTGPFAVAAALLVAFFLPGPRRLADRLVVVMAAVLGWIPFLGWVPGLATAVDVPGVLLAVGAGIAVPYRVALRRRRVGDRRAPTAPAVDLVALGVAAAVGLWWAIPFFRHGLVHRFSLIVAGWDNTAHLHLLGLNLARGNVTTVRPYADSGYRFFGWEYPQGLHHAWSQWVRLWDPTPATEPHSLVNTYVVLVLVTAALTVMLGCIGVARLCPRRTLVALPVMAVVAQLVAVGPLSTTVWVGYPNFGIAVVAVAVAPSLLLRPRFGPRLTFFVVGGLLLVAAHNWHPITALAGVAVLVSVARLWTAARGNLGRAAVVAATAATAALAVLPVLPTLTIGTDVLLAVGGTPAVDRRLFAASAFSLMAAAAAYGAWSGRWSTAVAVGAPGAIGSAGVAGLAAYQIASTGSVMYYAEKLATAVTAASIVGLAILVVSVAARLRLPAMRPLSRAERGWATMAAVLASMAALQLSGYVGPASNTVAAKQTAEGFGAHAQFNQRDPLAEKAVEQLLAAATAARAGGAGTWVYLDVDGGVTSSDLSDMWFATLVGRFDRPRLPKALALAGVNDPGAVDPRRAADLVAAVYPKVAGKDVRLVAPPAVVDELVRRGHPWNDAGLLWGHFDGILYPAVPLGPVQQPWLPLPATRRGA